MTSIPKIDIKDIFDDNSFERIASEIKDAYTNVGFAYLINQPLDKKVIQNGFKAADMFHKLPLDMKMKIKQNDCFRGYVPMKASQLKVSTQGVAKKPNHLDAFVMAFEPQNENFYKEGIYLNGHNQFPELEGFKELMFEYRDNMLKLAFRLLEVFSMILDQKRDYLKKYFTPPTYFLRLQHYPAVNSDESDLYGISPHTDYGFYTILCQQSEEGLEVLDTENNKWIEVPYIENSFVLNASDMLKRISNDTLKSTPHRVRNKSQVSRYSIPFFFEPNMEAILETVPTCIADGHKDPYPKIMYGDYLMERIKGNYNLGKTSK